MQNDLLPPAAPPPHRNGRSWHPGSGTSLALLAISALGITVASLLAGCYGNTLDGPEQGPEVAPAVEVVAARAGSLPLQQRLSGVVKAQNQVAIHPEVSGAVAEVFVRSGDAVSIGQPLVRLDDTTLNEQLRQAEAAVTLAEASAAEARARLAEQQSQVTRTRILAERSLVSELELEMREAQLDGAEASTAQAVARVEQARATADERRSALGKSVIRAPVSGRVGQRNAEVGMLADRSTLLFVIGNLDRVRIEVPITENMLGFLRAGQEVRIRAAGLGEEPRSAKLSRVSPFLTENSFSTIGEIDVDNRDGALHPGMFISVDVLYGESRQATLVPSSALWEDPQSGVLGIYVITGLGRADGTLSTSTGPSSTRPSSKMPTSGANPLVSEVSTQTHPVAFRPVKVLAEGRGSAGVEGLDEGEWVVTVGQHLLQQDRGEAFVRTTTWERVLELQGLQREDMLRDFLEQQQFLARHRGTAVLPPLGEMTEIASLTASRVGEAAQGANL